MSKQDKLNSKIQELMTDFFKTYHKDNSNLKIDAVNLSFKISYQIKGKSKFMQNMICPLPHAGHNKITNLKTIVAKDLLQQVDAEDKNIVILEDLDKQKIKKLYNIAIVDNNKINKSYKSILVKKSILDSKLNTQEMINLYNQIKQDKCTKLMQTNNTISCKIGNLTQGIEEMQQNLSAVIKYLQQKSIFIKTVSLMLHGNKKMKINI